MLSAVLVLQHKSCALLQGNCQGNADYCWKKTEQTFYFGAVSLIIHKLVLHFCGLL